MHHCKRAILPAAAAAAAVAVAVVVVALLLVSSVTVSAAGAGAVSQTQTFHNATDSFPTANPCTGVPSTATLTYNGVMHYTVNKAGDVWATGTQTGSFVLVPDDPTQPTYTGHFTSWFGVSDNQQNGVDHSTFTIHGTGSDGSTLSFHEVAHLSVSASGLTVSFDRPSCG
jgi:hypothetical protein